MEGKPNGWITPFRKTSASVHLKGGVPFDLLMLNLLGAVTTLCMTLTLAGGRLMTLAVLAPVQFLALHALFRHLSEDDPWWWAILRERMASAGRRKGRRRSNLLRHM